MRFFILDKFNTWYDWRLTLTAKDVTPAEPKTNYVSLDGASGSLDLTESLTGEVAYNDRTVTASFVTSEGTFSDRVRLLKEITAALHGKKVQIIEPDDPDHFFLGRVRLKTVEQTQVRLKLTLEATCDPWRYAAEESRRAVTGGADVVINNGGMRSLCPVLNVAGTVGLTVNGSTTTLTPGRYKITDLRLRQGVNVVKVTGTGSVTFVYREATI